MVCGGQSRLKKSTALLDEYWVKEELSLFRYRGYGNPGLNRIETKDGHAFEKTYLELWEDKAGWEIETRCKLCPDSLGEAADIAAFDVWPGGSPICEGKRLSPEAREVEREGTSERVSQGKFLEKE